MRDGPSAGGPTGLPCPPRHTARPGRWPAWRWAGAALMGTACAASAQVASVAQTDRADNPWAAPEAWLCRPGRQDACAGPVERIRMDAGGSTVKDSVAADPSAPVDCFYVYPTVSTDPNGNSGLVPGPGELRAAEQQLSMLASVCRPYAPMYRQITLAGLRSVMAGRPMPMDANLAYADVLAAWKHYLAVDNQGRGVVLVGHSQGSRWLAQLLQREIDGKPDQRRVVSAILAGYNFEVPAGRTSGGTLPSMPLCTAAGQTGCVVAWVSFRAASPPPDNALFGVSRKPGVNIACVDPVALSEAPMSSYLPIGPNLVGAPPPLAGWLSAEQARGSPFVDLPGLLSARCTQDGSRGYLAIQLNAEAAGARPQNVPGDAVSNGRVLADWGLHLIDIGLVAGNLQRLVRQQAVAYEAQRAQSTR